MNSSLKPDSQKHPVDDIMSELAPGSSQDYVVWRWRQEVNPNGIMLPPDCYTKKQIA